MPVEIVEKIISFLPLKARVKVMRVNRCWRRLAESCLARQSTLAVVDERKQVPRYFVCCFGCHETYISPLNFISSYELISLFRWDGASLARYCPGIRVIKVESNREGEVLACRCCCRRSAC